MNLPFSEPLAPVDQPDALIGDLKVSTVTRSVADHIREAIRSGALPPGSRLRQQHIARSLGVSTTPVREALRLLAAEGLVTLGEHRGAEVFRPSIDDVVEYYEMREVLEALAIRNAVPNITDDGIRELEELLDAMDAADDHDDFSALNHRFHSTLYAWSKRPRLCATIAGLAQRTSGYASLVIDDAMRSGRSSTDHHRILDACRRRDADAAAEAIREHLEVTVQTTIEKLRSRTPS